MFRTTRFYAPEAATAVVTPPAAPTPPAAAVVDPPPAGTPPAASATPAPQPSTTGTPDAQPAQPTVAAVPDAYDLKLQDPTKSYLDADALDVIKAEAKALGLTQEQAQRYLDVRDTTLTTAASSFLHDAKADPEIGGDKFDQAVEFGKQGLAYLFPNQEERELVTRWFQQTGLGSHKVFIRAMARIGRMRQEDAPPGGVGGPAGSTKPQKTTEQKFYPSHFPDNH